MDNKQWFGNPDFKADLNNKLVIYFYLHNSIEQVNNLREIQALRRLNPHPNILTLHEVVLWVYWGFKKYLTSMIIVRSLFRKENHSRRYKYWLCSSDTYLDQCLHPSPKVERPLLQWLRVTAATVIQMVPLRRLRWLLCGRRRLGTPVCQPCCPPSGAALRSSLQLPSWYDFMQPFSLYLT